MITVTGIILGPDDSPVVGEVVFHALSTPTFESGLTHLTAVVRVETDTEGNLRRKFSAGYYDVESHVNGSRVARNPVKRFRILVPEEIGGNPDAVAEISTLVVPVETPMPTPIRK